MKQLLKIFTLLLITTISYAQPRVDKVFPKFIESTKALTKSTEYEYSEYSGKWDSRVVSFGVPFRKIEFKSIVVNDEKYYIMIVDCIDGAYKYPNIKKDFQTWDVYRAYIFNSEQYQQIKNFQSVESKFGEVYVPRIGNNSSISDLEIAVYKEINYKLSYNDSQTFKIKLEDEKTVRFIIQLGLSKTMIDKYYGFDKKYFESDINEFKKLLSLD